MFGKVFTIKELHVKVFITNDLLEEMTVFMQYSEAEYPKPEGYGY